MWKQLGLVLCCLAVLPFVVQAQLLRTAQCNYYNHTVFGYTCEVADLVFNDGDQLQITGTHMPGMSHESVILVDIANSTLGIIPLQFFVAFPGMSRFYAQGASLETLNRLQNCQSLEHLFLSQNNLRTISADTFVDCTNLKVLQLMNNHISTIDRWAFRDMDNLEVLLLTNNDIEVINADLFTPTPNLLDLGLGNNYITTLNVRTFTPTPLLEVLRLGNNQIAAFNVNIFINLNNLHTLLLNGNNFDQFQANLFRVLPSLKTLNLNDNVVSG